MRKSLPLIGLLWALNAFAGDPVYEVGVDGLACPFCAYGVEKQLSRVSGVREVETDIAKGVVVLRVEPGASLDEDAVRDAVRKAGFTPRSFGPQQRRDTDSEAPKSQS